MSQLFGRYHFRELFSLIQKRYVNIYIYINIIMFINYKRKILLSSAAYCLPPRAESVSRRQSQEWKIVIFVNGLMWKDFTRCDRLVTRGIHSDWVAINYKKNVVRRYDFSVCFYISFYGIRHHLTFFRSVQIGVVCRTVL